MDRKESLLKLLEKAESDFREYKKYSNGGFQNRLKKLIKYRWKYLIYAISIITKKPLPVKAKVFWGEYFSAYLPDARYIFLFNILDDSEIRLTKFFIKNLKNNSVFFDIGAGYGFYSLLAKQLVTEGEVHAFEPVPRTFKLLQKNLSNKNGVFLNQIAHFNSEKIINFYESLDGRSGLNTFNLSNIEAIVNPFLFRQIKVRTTTIDNYCLSCRTKPTFIKIDVEGAEDSVIEGGINTLEKFNPIIAMEVWRKPLNNEGHLKAIKILKELGYKPYSITNTGEIMKKEEIFPEKDIADLDDNFIFIKD